MFGGQDTNSLLPFSMDGGRLAYNATALPPMQLDVLAGSNAGLMNIAEDKNASLGNLPVKLGRATPIFSQYKLPVTLHDVICQDEAAQAGSMLKHIPVSTGLKLSYGEEEHNSSISSAGDSAMANLSSMLSHGDNLQSEFVRQNDELDQYIKIQEENIIKGITELKHRHTISLLNALEKEVSCRMHEKDLEIQKLNCRNKELVEKIRQIAIEAQSWHYRAKQNEHLVNVLKSNINQVFLQGAACFKEGYGESIVDDAVSSCNQNRLDPFVNFQMPSSVFMKEPDKCKACNTKEVSVLLLPCRHLCLCTGCEVFIDICPVCRVKKAGSLQVYMS